MADFMGCPYSNQPSKPNRLWNYTSDAIAPDGVKMGQGSGMKSSCFRVQALQVHYCQAVVFKPFGGDAVFNSANSSLPSLAFQRFGAETLQ